MSFLNFDANAVEPNRFSLLPAGKYKAMITQSEVVDTKAGNGQRLKLTWRIIEGEFANKIVFDNINVGHVNQEVQAIGQSILSSLCHAAGVLRLKDSEELHGIPVYITVVVNPPKDGYPEDNKVKRYESVGNSNTATPKQNHSSTGFPVPPATPPGVKKTPPFMAAR